MSIHYCLSNPCPICYPTQTKNGPPISTSIENVEFDTIAVLKARILELENAARNLRLAQKNYMSNRGNQEYGKAVAVAAKELDRILGDV